MTTPDDPRQFVIQQLLNVANLNEWPLKRGSELNDGQDDDEPSDDADDQREGGDSGSP